MLLGRKCPSFSSNQTLVYPRKRSLHTSCFNPSALQIGIIKEHQLHKPNPHLLLHLIVLLVDSVRLLGRRSLLLLDLPLNLLRHEIFIALQRLLDMYLELNNIIQHPFQFGVELFSQRGRPQRQLLIPTTTVSSGSISWCTGGTYSRFVFISRCSINCTLSLTPALILESLFSIFSICASEAIFCALVSSFMLSNSS